MGNRHQNNLTQVTPSARAVIKTDNKTGRLWSSTIATSLWLPADAASAAPANS